MHNRTPRPPVEARARRRWLIVGAIVLALLVVGAPLAMTAVARALVVADPLERAPAVVVFGGGFPYRTIEAARVYRGGWAREVWLTEAAGGDEEKVLRQLGITIPREAVYNRAVLERLGVPATSVRVLDTRVHNTAEEVQAIADALRRQGSDRVVLVTSKAHTRRVKVLWHMLVGNSPRAIVRYATDDPFEPDRWWKNSRVALETVREVLGLANAWAGFPLRPES